MENGGILETHDAPILACVHASYNMLESPDAEIRTIVAEQIDDISSEDEMEDHEYISFDYDGEIDEILPALDISDEEVEHYQINTEKT